MPDILSGGALLISSRDRAVWTRSDKKILDRCAKVFNLHGDKLLLLCGNPCCPDPRMGLVNDGSDPAGMSLRCGCTDRVFSRTA